MLEFNPDDSKSDDTPSDEDIAKQHDEAFMQWITDHATDRDINRDRGAE